MAKHQSIFKLTEIAEWPQNSFVELPKVQRGFVWRPYQIEDLWDSLLRKYPIGSFVFNKQKDGKLQLLDGQQRATAITLGFANKTFKGSEDHFKLFIDLELPEKDARKYYFRVITDSHPWGYQKKQNNKPLDAQQKREAIKCWEEINLINPDLSKCYPYDSTLPIPLNLFLDAAIANVNEADIYNSICNWELWNKVNAKLQNYLQENPKRLELNKQIGKLSIDNAFVRERIYQIYSEIKKMLTYHEIPALYLDNVLEIQDNENLEQNNENHQNDQQEHEVENLFVRLNAGGTPLRGEELNYSILKSKILPETQKKIEDACEYFIFPARFITVAFRLHQYADDSKTGRDALGMNIKPRQFQSRLKEKKDIDNFEVFILSLLEDKYYNSKTLIDYTKQILEYHPDENEAGFPHLIARKLVNNSPELLFMLWFRLMIKKDQFPFVLKSDNNLHPRMLGILSIFLWFGKSDSNRDYSKLLSNIWPAMKSLDNQNFWSLATIKRAMLNEVLLPIPSYARSTFKNPSIKWFAKQNPTLKSAMFDKFYKISPAGFNAEILFFNNDLVLYAQRDFLFKIFHHKQYHLDDTNVPFDWDHIYPHKLISGKKHVPKLIKDFYNSIGNFRAWPYELNRMDSDDTPFKKFNPLTDSDTSEDLKLSWQRFINNHPDLISDIKELPKKLPLWSNCKSNWTQSDIIDLKKDGKEVIKLIINRAVDIIGIWYNGLCIEDIILETSKGKSSFIQSGFYSNKFDVNPKWLNKKEWDLRDNFNLIIKKSIKVENALLRFYITFSKNSKDILGENEILFGIFDSNRTGLISKLRGVDDSNFEINKEEHYLQGYFTLVSEHNDSLSLLLKDIFRWLNHKQFPLKAMQKQIKEIFVDALKKNYKPKF